MLCCKKPSWARQPQHRSDVFGCGAEDEIRKSGAFWIGMPEDRNCAEVLTGYLLISQLRPPVIKSIYFAYSMGPLLIMTTIARAYRFGDSHPRWLW